LFLNCPNQELAGRYLGELVVSCNCLGFNGLRRDQQRYHRSIYLMLCA